MKCRMALFSFLIILAMIDSLPATAADGRYFRGTDAAAGLLAKEIERDKKIISYKMNLARLRQTKELLAADLPLKQTIIDALLKEGGRNGNTAWLITLLQQSAAAEQGIVDNSTSRRLRRQAQGHITRNLEKKKKALDRLTK